MDAKLNFFNTIKPQSTDTVAPPGIKKQFLLGGKNLIHQHKQIWVAKGTGYS